MRRTLVISAVLIAALLLPLADAWFALTKEGYRVKGNLTNEGHLLVIDNIKLEGVFLLGQNNSESGALDGMNQKCDSLREGALRYNNTHVEGCKQNRWRPLAFCDYECRPRDDVPCGALVYSSCGDRITTGFYCEGMFGLGLNLAQCSLNTNSTSCGDPVYDDCGNFCGTDGVNDCATSEMKRYVGLDILPVQCPPEPSFAPGDWSANAFDDSAWSLPSLVALNFEQCPSCISCSSCSSCNSPGKSPPTRFNDLSNCSACIDCPTCTAHKNLLTSLKSTKGNTIAVASATLWPYYPQFDPWTPWLWSSDYRKHDLVYFRMRTNAMYYPITAKSSAVFSLYINGSLCTSCTGSASSPVSINASVARGWDIITLISTASPSSFSLVLAGQVITPDLIRCASLVSPTSLTYDTFNWTNPSLRSTPATTSVLGSLSVSDVYFSPAHMEGATATVCQLVAPSTMMAELSCDRDFDIFVKGQWIGKGGGRTEPDSPLISNAAPRNMSETWKFDLPVVGSDVVALQARSLAFGGCIGMFGGVPMSNATWKVAHFGNSDHTNSNYNTLFANNQSSQASGSCMFDTKRRGLVANGSALLPKSSQQSARPSYRKSAPPPGVDGSTNLYRIVQHGVGGLLFQSGNITITHSKISDRLINNLTNIRSGVGIVKRTYNISTVMEMTPVLGLGVRLEGVSDDDGGELILGSPMEVRNSRVIVDGDMWSTEDVFLGNGMEDTVSFGGRINGSRSLALQGAHWSSRDTLTLTLPLLAGADAAIRSYLINEAPAIPIRANHPRWGSVLYPITSLVLNPQVCCAVARGLNVASFQNLSSFLVNNSLVVMDISGSTPRVDLSILDGYHSDFQFFDLKTRLASPAPSQTALPRYGVMSPSLQPMTATPLRALTGDVKASCNPSSPRTLWNRDWNTADAGFPCKPDADVAAAVSLECDDTWVRALLKCAALNWLPSQVDFGSELVVPEASGTLLSTGNLADITVDAGYMTGVSIKRELVVDGSTVLGSASSGASFLKINAAIVGQTAFSLRGQSNAASQTRVEVQDPSHAQQVLSVPDSDGTILTSGSSAMLSGAFVVGPFESSGSFTVQSSNITLGVNHTLDTMMVNAGIVEGLAFEGKIIRNNAITRLDASEPSSGENHLHLPDVSGTILVAGGSSSVVSDVTVTDSAHLQGRIVIDGNILLSNASSVDFAATISSAHALTFDSGLGTSARSTLSIEAPSTSSSSQWLPDADGTILMTSQAPPLEKLTVTDSLYSNGVSTFNGQIYFGDSLPTTVSFQQALVLGAYPLTFESADASGKTLLLHTPVLGSDVVITLPDTSGTLLTAIPSTWAADDNLAIVAPAINVNVARIALGAALAENSAPNSFTFSDSSVSFSARANEFAVCATGGVRMCASASASDPASPAPEPSIELLPGDVMWRSRFSVSSAMNLALVNETNVLNAVSSHAAIHSWSFASSPTSAHVGPLPQHWAGVLSSLNISSVSSDSIAAADVDGVLLASVRELNRRLIAAETAVSELQSQQQEQQQQQQRRLLSLRANRPPVSVRLALCINDTACENALGCSGSGGNDDGAQVVAGLGVCTPVSINQGHTSVAADAQQHSVVCSDCVSGRAACTWFDGDAECFGMGTPMAFKAQGSWTAGEWGAGVCGASKVPYSRAQPDVGHGGHIRLVYRGVCLPG